MDFNASSAVPTLALMAAVLRDLTQMNLATTRNLGEGTLMVCRRQVHACAKCSGGLGLDMSGEGPERQGQA